MNNRYSLQLFAAVVYNFKKQSNVLSTYVAIAYLMVLKTTGVW